MFTVLGETLLLTDWGNLWQFLIALFCFRTLTRFSAGQLFLAAGQTSLHKLTPWTPIHACTIGRLGGYIVCHICNIEISVVLQSSSFVFHFIFRMLHVVFIPTLGNCTNSSQQYISLIIVNEQTSIDIQSVHGRASAEILRIVHHSGRQITDRRCFRPHTEAVRRHGNRRLSLRRTARCICSIDNEITTSIDIKMKPNGTGPHTLIVAITRHINTSDHP